MGEGHPEIVAVMEKEGEEEEDTEEETEADAVD